VILAIVPVLLWQVHVGRVHRSEEYRHPAYSYQRAAYQHYNVTYFENIRLLDPFKPEQGVAGTSALVSRVVTNLVKMPIFLGQGVSAPEEYWRSALKIRPVSRVNLPMCVVLLPIILLGTLVIAGVIFFLRAGQWTLAALIVLSVGLMCLTPWPEEFNRYLVPVAPFLAIAAVVAMRQLSVFLCDHTNPSIAKVAKLSLVSVLVMTLLVQIGTATRFLLGSTLAKSNAQSNSLAAGAHFFYKQDWVDWENAATWIGEHASGRDIVATTAPHQFYLQTGLRAVYPPFEPDPGKASRLIEGVPLKYVLIDQFAYRDFSRRYASPAVENDPARWRLVYAIHRTKVYEHYR
jgi:hypothetical protein